MSNSPAKPHRRFIARDLFRVFAAGLLVGIVVWLLAQARPGSADTLVSSIVFVAASSASIVCYTLGGAGSRAKARAHEVPAWLCAIGVGIVLSMHALNFIALAA